MEKLLQYAWQHRFWKSPTMTTSDGQKITILDPGWLNHNAGPDFFNAKIILDGKEWVGNIEVHIKASDWYRHGHHLDSAYNSVILHVVDTDDMKVANAKGQILPQLVIKCDSEVTALYNKLLTAGTLNLVCSDSIAGIPDIYINNWIDSLAYERIYNKSERFSHYLKITGNDYEQALFIAVARALGFGRNNDIFERIAISIPLKIIGRHSDSPVTVESIVFGQAQLIPVDATTPYIAELKREYDFMAHKFGLIPPNDINWNFGRIRPQNMPYRRLAALAHMAAKGFRLLTPILEAKNIDELRNIFRFELSGYWSTAISFTNARGAAPKAFSDSAIDSLLINAAIPAIYTFGIMRDRHDVTERSLDLLRALPPENNSIVRTFTDAGIKCENAYTSQALIQLHRIYCENRKCLFCRIGYRMLKRRQ